MSERLKWAGERRVYQPRIKADQIHNLHDLKELYHKPMTILLREAIDLYLAAFVNLEPYQLQKAKDEADIRITDEWDDKLGPEPEDLPIEYET